MLTSSRLLLAGCVLLLNGLAKVVSQILFFVAKKVTQFL